MQLSARIIEIFETQNISATFKKREFVLEFIERQHPEYIKFEFVQDKCDLLDKYQIGQDVNIEFNLKGRKWENPQGEVKYFNTLQAWRIEGATSQGEPPTANEAPPMDYDNEEGAEVAF
jgi:hypothetical protein